MSSNQSTGRSVAEELIHSNNISKCLKNYPGINTAKMLTSVVTLSPQEGSSLQRHSKEPLRQLLRSSLVHEGTPSAFLA